MFLFGVVYIQSVTKDTSGLMFRKSSWTWPLYTRRWRPLVINIVVKAHHFFCVPSCFPSCLHVSSVRLAGRTGSGPGQSAATCDWPLQSWWLMSLGKGAGASGKIVPAQHERCVNNRPRPSASSSASSSVSSSASVAYLLEIRIKSSHVLLKIHHITVEKNKSGSQETPRDWRDSLRSAGGLLYLPTK